MKLTKTLPPDVGSNRSEASPSISPTPRARHGSGRRGNWVLLGVGLLLVVLLIAWASDQLPGRGPQSASGYLLHPVVPGPLRITVVEQGSLESASNLDVRCEVEGGRVGSGGSSGSGTQIIWLFPEGEFVRKGEKIVELDQSGLKQQEIEQQIAYESARQVLITAKNTYEASKIAVDEYLHGTSPQELETVEAEIVVAKEGLRTAEEYARYSENLYRKGFLSKTSLEADQFAVENARLVLQAAERKKLTLLEYTKKKMLVELESLRDSAEATMKAAESKFQLEETKLAQIRDQLTKCTIYAQKDGMVIYANSRERRSRSEGVEIEEGAMVRLRQIIIQLPELTQMRVRASVHESVIERVKKDQKVKIRIDALPHLSLNGVVSTINNQPEPGSWYASNVKEYAVYVTIDEKVENLKPGMTAEVEILVNQLEDVISIPVQAVVQKGDQSYCYVAKPEGVGERPVVLGASNDVFIEIKDGLNEGEQVILNPRAVVPDARLAPETKKEPSRQETTSGNSAA